MDTEVILAVVTLISTVLTSISASMNWAQRKLVEVLQEASVTDRTREEARVLACEARTERSIESVAKLSSTNTELATALRDVGTVARSAVDESRRNGERAEAIRSDFKDAFAVVSRELAAIKRATPNSRPRND